MPQECPPDDKKKKNYMKANSFGADNNILDNSFTIQSSPQLLALLRLPGFEVMTCSGKQPTVEALIICISPPRCDRGQRDSTCVQPHIYAPGTNKTDKNI